MSMEQRLNSELKDAMRSKNDLALSTIRMIKSVVKNREIELKRSLNDQEIIEAISTLVKQRKESIRLYNEGNRPDLVAKEEQELEFLMGFLPKQLTQTEIEEIVDQAIKDLNASDMRDMGKVMKAITPLVSGKADGKVVSDTVRGRLTK